MNGHRAAGAEGAHSSPAAGELRRCSFKAGESTREVGCSLNSRIIVTFGWVQFVLQFHSNNTIFIDFIFILEQF